MTWSQENCLVMNHCLYLRVTGKGFYRERILCAQIIFFRESIPFLYRRKGIFISMIHAMHQEDASRCLCRIYQCFLNMLFSD